MSPRPPKIIYDPKEEDLPTDCELTIIDPMQQQRTEYTMEELDLLNQFPETEHPSWNAGTSELWEPEERQWYEQQAYDRVLVCDANCQTSAEVQLLRQCMRFGYRRVGEVFQSTGKFCLRVRNVEV